MEVEKMKCSRFNVVVEKKEDDVLMYNTLTGAIVKISPSLLTMIQKDPKLIDDKELIESLKEVGISVDDDFD